VKHPFAVVSLVYVGLALWSGTAMAEPQRSLRYELKALGAGAGEAVLIVGSPEKVGKQMLRPIRIDARTEGLAANFLKADSVATTWVDERWLPIRSRWDQVIDGLRRVIKGSFSAKGVAGSEERNGKPFEKHDHQLGKHPLDLVSIFTWIMHQKLEPGLRFSMPVFDGRRIYQVDIQVGVIGEILLPIGHRRAIPLAVTISRGSYRRQAELWVSAEKEAVPLKVVFKYGLIGTVEAMLASERRG
jgi:hypothetical protein